jgi:hypothetical protein
MSKDKNKIIQERNCRVCDNPTKTIFNINFSMAAICEDCAKSIFIQQATWYIKNDQQPNK